MQVRVGFLVVLFGLLGACAQVNASLGRGDGSATPQAQVTPADPALAGLDMIEGGYARFERTEWGCDYECYNFPGRWLADAETPLYAEPRISAPIIEHIAVGESLNAVRYEIHVQPRRGVVTRAGGGFEIGEVIYELWMSYNGGLGAATFWRGGRMIELAFVDEFEDEGDGDEPEVFPEVLYQEPSGADPDEAIDWVYVEREGGRRNGWLRDPMMPGVRSPLEATVTFVFGPCAAYDISYRCQDIRSRAEPSGESFPAPQPFRDCAICPAMVLIPEQPFAVGQYEVTFAEWDACVAAGGCNGHSPNDQGWGRGNRPVIGVSWVDAQAYILWLNEHTGKRYRLPTTREWAAAAFPGGRQQNYSWGNESPVCDPGARNGVAYNACMPQRTLPVGSFQPNAYGLYDTIGNVAEWLQDPYSLDDGGGYAVIGSSWASNLESLGGLGRGWQQHGGPDTGFRVAQTPSSATQGE